MLSHVQAASPQPMITHIIQNMSKYLRTTRQDLKARIFAKLGLPAEDDPASAESLRSEESSEQLEKMLKDTCSPP